LAVKNNGLPSRTRRERRGQGYRMEAFAEKTLENRQKRQTNVTPMKMRSPSDNE